MAKEMPKTYDHSIVESGLYEKWEKNGYFHAEPNPDKDPYCIVIPPPNITGKLHMGHALDNTLQDAIIRYKRMSGYETLWLPGTDHASIATEVKIVTQMAAEGIDKRDIGREAFLERAWDWRREYGGAIVQQLKKLGSSCDWERERFTMDEGCNRAVTKVFVDLYHRGLIYRDDRIINWCPECQTALSDAEVEYEEQNSHLWHVRYDAPDKSYSIICATTRPETIPGDTAIAVNPEDERYADLIGKTVVVLGFDRFLELCKEQYVNKMARKEKKLVALLKKKGLSITTAESCTGGMIASNIISVNGASEVMAGAFVAYSNEMKQGLLGVSREDIEKYSAVSPRVAIEMAKGARLRTGAQVAISTTGYAGPTGDQVGLVYIGISVGAVEMVYRFEFDGDRQSIREACAATAVNLVRREIKDR